ncbi:arylsulfotransferase family protein [Streptomyces sp. B6B3]|uniref:arylsulfotransferase family protein n=1 Tax=Streptomyces sp. B6B3 TaxID=3153570 RepID=UPI00325D86C4
MLVGALAAGTPLVASGRAVAAGRTAGQAEAPAAAPTAAETTAEPVYRSRPDIVAAVLTTTRTGREDPGLLLSTPSGSRSAPPSEAAASDDGDEPPEEPPSPRGAAIYDNDGELVWWYPGQHGVISPITFRGRPALSMFSNGQGIVLDASYQEIASFTIVGLTADAHEFTISPDSSRVLHLSYLPVPYDLSPYGGSVDGVVVTSIIQEQDATTGEVTWEWDALDHIPLTETHQTIQNGVHFVHTNSLKYDHDGNILMSGKETSTIYKIDRSSGEIIWRFGGKASDFTFADPESMPSSQHDALRLADGRLSVFDNGNHRDPQYSRGAVWSLDETTMTATLDEDLQPDEPVFSPSGGSNQMTDSGSHLVAYGITSRIVEFLDGEPVFTANFEDGRQSYRVRRAGWKGTPAVPPDVAWTVPDAAGRRTFYVSWNGATEVRCWRIEARVPLLGYVPLDTVRRTGFETAATVTAPRKATRYRIRALDRHGHVLGTREITEEDTPPLPE